MRWIEIKGKNNLRGTVDIVGSKNSSVALLAASCLANDDVTLNNLPHISDVNLICSILKDLGCNIVRYRDSITIKTNNINTSYIDIEKSSEYRASYYFIGALLSKFKKVTLGYPGGDNFGSRPIDQHIKGFEALGAKFSFYEKYYTVEIEKLKGNNIFFDVITSGATINVMMAAVLAEGRTVMLNAARDPEVVDVAIMLNKMGAKIKGMGTDTITIDGVERLGGCNHTVIPDRLIAGSLIIAAAATKGDVIVNNIIPEHLLSCTAKLEEAGVNIETGDSYIRAYVDDKVRGINLKTAMYPGFATDLQQPLTSMLLTASEHSKIIDTIYPQRFNHCTQLNRMGADIIMRDGSIVIPANRKITGAWVHATDVRAGMCLIIAGLIADGVTCITGVEHIERGYANIIDTFVALGADIKMCEDLNNEKPKENIL